jgi:uncharacterized protein YycO
MDYVKVIYGRTWKPLSLLIQLRTLSRWSHVGLIIGDNVIESKGGIGVVITPLQQFKDRYTSTLIGEIPCISKQYAEEYVMSRVGNKYDFKAIIGAALNLNIHKSSAYHCSELIAGATGLFNKELLATVSPETLRKLTK